MGGVCIARFGTWLSYLSGRASFAWLVTLCWTLNAKICPSMTLFLVFDNL